jgi:hypothetical protein
LLASPGSPLPRRDQIIPSHFQATRSSVSVVTQVVLWQYRMNVPIGSAVVDLDMSTRDGYADMWSR